MFLEQGANRGSISTGPYEIDYSIRFDNVFNYPNSSGPADDWLHRDTANNGGLQGDVSTKDSGGGQKWVMSFWHKRGASWAHRGGGDAERNRQGIMGGWMSARSSWIGFDSIADNEDAFVLSLKQSDQSVDFITNAQYRDYASWYHFFIKLDTTQNTSTDRLQLWVNGVRVTSWDAYPTIAEDGENMHFWADGVRHYIGRNYYGYGTVPCTGYLADFYFLHNDTTGSGNATITDTSGYVATTFGEFDDNGIWVPIDPSSDITFGDQAYHLDFADSSDFGNDVGGVGNHFADSSLNTHNQTTDTPTNNFCVLDPNWEYANNPTTGPYHGNLKVSGGSWAGTKATMGVEKGKWYWEFKADSASSIVGIQTDGEGDIVNDSGNAHNIIGTCAIYLEGEVWIKDSTSGRNDTDVTQTFNSSHVYGIALNMDDNQISFYQNGSLITNGGSIALDGLANKVVFPFASNYNSLIEFNFGNPPFSISSSNADANGYGNFEHAPPSGYYALCTKNLAEYG